MKYFINVGQDIMEEKYSSLVKVWVLSLITQNFLNGVGFAEFSYGKFIDKLLSYMMEFTS